MSAQGLALSTPAAKRRKQPSIEMNERRTNTKDRSNLADSVMQEPT
jgi:hypothetical protein